MKLVLVSSLLYAVNARHVSMEERRALQAFSANNVDCSTCFDNIDNARDCLRECNNKAYPGDNCCCCCECNGDDDQWNNQNNNGHCNGNNNNNNNQCNGNSCKWTLDKQSNNNKWYNIDQYCKCDHVDNNNKNNCDKNSDLKQNEDDPSLLDFCLGDDAPKNVQDIKDLSICCDFDDQKCDDYFTEVQDCLIGCLNPCMVITAGNWLDCLQDNANAGSCSREECLNGFLYEDPTKSEDIFDLKSLEKRVDKIDEADLQDCSLLTDFIDTTCGVGKSCCSKCQPELGTAIDCLINDIVVPFSAAALNITVTECPVDTDKCAAAYRRELTEAEAEKFNRAISLPRNKEEASRVVLDEAGEMRKLETDTSASATSSSVPSNASQAAVEVCQRKMERDIMAKNMSYATNNFMSCVMELGYGALSDGSTTSADGGTTTTATSSAATLVSMVGLLSAMVIAALF